MAESMPGTIDVFAEAFASLSGSGLEGQPAVEALYKAVESGSVESAKILPLVSQILSKRAEPKLGVMKKTSIAEQARFQNTMSDLVNAFSKAGGEKGFAAIFRGLTSQTRESTNLVEKLGSAFEFVGFKAERLLVWTESFNRALEGRDSQVADWLGEEKTEQLRNDWAQIKVLLDEIFSMGTPSWMPSLEKITIQLQQVLESIATVSRFKNETLGVMSQIYSDEQNSGRYSSELAAKLAGGIKAAGFGLKSLTGLGGDALSSGFNRLQETLPFAGSNPALNWASRQLSGLSGYDPVAEYWMNRNPSMSYDTAQGWRDQYNAMTKEAAVQSIVSGKYNYGFQPGNTISGNTFNMEFTVDGGAEGLETWFRSSFQQEVENALQFFNYNE